MIKIIKLAYIVFLISVLGANLYAAKLGDVNEDDFINIIDSLLIAQHYISMNPASFNAQYADVDCSKTVTIVDAMFIAQFYIGIIDDLPCSNISTPENDWQLKGVIDIDDGYNFQYSIHAINISDKILSGNLHFRFFLTPEDKNSLSYHSNAIPGGGGDPLVTTAFQQLYEDIYYYDIIMGNVSVNPGEFIGYQGSIIDITGGLNSANDWSGSDIPDTFGEIKNIGLYIDDQYITGTLPLAPLTADFNFLPFFPGLDENISFSAVMENPDYHYLWFFDEAVAEEGRELEFSFSQRGIHRVSLQVTDLSGNVRIVSKNIYVTEGPVADFNWSVSDDGFSVNFDALPSFDKNGSEIENYFWDFGDGTTGQGLQVTHKYINNNKAYDVSLSLTNGLGQTSTMSDQISFIPYIERNGAELLENNQRFRFVSVNIPYYSVIQDQTQNSANQWYRVTEFEQKDAAQSVKRLGGRIFRINPFLVQNGPVTENPYAHVYLENGMITYNEELFTDLDRGIAIAKQEGLRMIIPLVDNWNTLSGHDQWEQMSGGSDFWNDPVCNETFRDFINYLLNRKNSVTGLYYKNDPTIMAWELGNELEDATASWISEMAAYIKHIDPRHLVIDGGYSELREISLIHPSIDIVTTHYTDSEIENFALDASEHDKAYLYGAFKPESPAQVADVVDRIIDTNAVGALIWSLSFRSRNGGFYFHSDFNGSSDALQYPGFDQGLPVNEAVLFQNLRKGAFAIQGLEPWPEPVPEQPKLLPIEDSNIINWRGSAGALYYIVQRSKEDSGIWVDVSGPISDGTSLNGKAALPLFSDDPENGLFFYRVIAFNNSGHSRPSLEVPYFQFKIIIGQ